MATKRPPMEKPRPTSSSTAAAKAKSVPAHATGRTIRETVESIAVAFVLAFLFRTFEAEAFVIPTGSMAPTLQGRHKDVVCPQCHFRYRVSASSEEDDQVQRARAILSNPTSTREMREAAEPRFATTTWLRRPARVAALRWMSTSTPTWEESGPRTTAIAFWWRNFPTTFPIPSAGT